ncbi:MAG: hypothetical protein H6639_16060 [Caldilineaceae bacterium]|nr:hypothetical protein [Caldilineaceae bacterium]
MVADIRHTLDERARAEQNAFDDLRARPDVSLSAAMSGDSCYLDERHHNYQCRHLIRSWASWVGMHWRVGVSLRSTSSRWLEPFGSAGWMACSWDLKLTLAITGFCAQCFLLRQTRGHGSNHDDSGLVGGSTMLFARPALHRCHPWYCDHSNRCATWRPRSISLLFAPFVIGDTIETNGNDGTVLEI